MAAETPSRRCKAGGLWGKDGLEGGAGVGRGGTRAPSHQAPLLFFETQCELNPSPPCLWPLDGIFFPQRRLARNTVSAWQWAHQWDCGPRRLVVHSHWKHCWHQRGKHGEKTWGGRGMGQTLGGGGGLRWKSGRRRACSPPSALRVAGIFSMSSGISKSVSVSNGVEREGKVYIIGQKTFD